MISGTATSGRTVPAPLRRAQQVSEHRQELRLGVGCRIVDVDALPGERLDQAAVGRTPLQHHGPEENEKCPARITRVQQRPALVDQTPDAILDHRPEQVLLGREMPVDRARADAGTAGDLVDGTARPSAANV